MSESPKESAQELVAQLANKMCDGTISAAERDQLESLLEQGDLCNLYLDYMQVNAWLLNRYRTGDPLSEGPEDEKFPTKAGRPFEGFAKRLFPGTLLALAAVLLVATVTTLVSFWSSPERWATVAESSEKSKVEARDPAEFTAAQRFVATLREATHAVWNNDDRPVNVGSRIEAGAVRIDGGEAELVFDSGARLIVAGPAELQLESPLVAFLKRGRVVAHMPPTAVGFEISTPTSKLIDQGTEFGVVAEEDGATEVHVFRGQVDLYYESGQEEPSRLELVDRQAHRVEEQGDAGKEIAFSRERFGNLSTRVAEPIQWKVADGGNGHYYQLVLEERPISWHEAARKAMQSHHHGLPGHLVTLTSEQEDAFVIDNLLSEYQAERGVWMGLTDVLREQHYRWVTGEPYEFTNWATWPAQQPDNFQEADWHGGEDYGMYTRFFDKQPWAWNDLSVDSIHEKVSAYLVEFEPPVDALRHGSMMLEPIHWPESEGGNGNYYRLVLLLEPADWETVRERALETEVLGVPGHLAALETTAERDFVVNEVLQICGIPDIMIGLSGSLMENNLKWVSGAPLVELEVNRPHLPTDLVYGLFRWDGTKVRWDMQAMAWNYLPDSWFGYLVEYPMSNRQVVE